MTISKRHRVLIAIDGSPAAQAALETAARFPWAASVRARAIFVSPLTPKVGDARGAADKRNEMVVEAARRSLARWKSRPEVSVVEGSPAAAIIAEAERYDATLVVLGWRGHGTFPRLLVGSV